MDNRVVLVTGAGQGIGRGVAERFLRAGDVVMLADIDEDALKTTGERFRADGFNCETRAIDIRKRDDIRSAVEELGERYGRLDVLSANAGIAGVKPFMQIDDAEWQRVLDVNLTGTFRCIQESARLMQRGGGGAIVVTTSTNAFWVETGTAHYSASKGGLAILVKSAAVDLAPLGIRVNAVAPGIVRTRLSQILTEDPVEGPAYLERIPLRRFAEAVDIAEAVFFLASKAAAYITGEQLVVDGGVTVGVHIPDAPSGFEAKL
jgi:NAD(P)-dependent dehydrogenase (short-subunit alcohol dehydrogenase family)